MVGCLTLTKNSLHEKLNMPKLQGSFSSEAILVPVLDSFHLKLAMMPKHIFSLEQPPCISIIFHPHICKLERSLLQCYFSSFLKKN